MWKYIVTWIVFSVQPTVCPNEGYFQEKCTIEHTQIVKVNGEKSFLDKEDATLFINRLELYNKESTLKQKGVEKIKLDSIKIKP
jgi:hypothetical protein